MLLDVKTMFEALERLREIPSAARAREVRATLERQGWVQIGEESGIDRDDESDDPERVVVWFVTDRTRCTKAEVLAALDALASRLHAG